MKRSPTIPRSTGAPTEELVAAIIELAIKEDLGPAQVDVTTDPIVSSSTLACASLYCKQEGVIAGLEVAARIFKRFDPDLKFSALLQDGDRVTNTPSPIARVEGSARAVLKGERLALNILQRMSGIATLTKLYIDKAKPFGIQILDTRKTTPGMRALEKLAVFLAGGTNHRFGLYDAVLIKDNHVSLAGSVKQAIELVRKAHPHLPVEVETTNLEEVGQALEAKAEHIMLDNMSPEEIRKAVALIDERAFIEVSGGINLDTIENYLIRGVDAISVGALTHSVRSLDISLEVERFV